MQRILSVPGNDKCADCSSRSELLWVTFNCEVRIIANCEEISKTQLLDSLTMLYYMLYVCKCWIHFILALTTDDIIINFVMVEKSIEQHLLIKP